MNSTRGVALLKQRRCAAGLCVYCGQEPMTPGKLAGPACRRKQADERKRLRLERLRSGTCRECGKAPVHHPSRLRCRKCLHAAAEMAWIYKRNGAQCG